ncbi:MAG: hypothetical protein AAGC78_02050 [Cellvibrio sp.]|uniref:hypothetical protein n=1 Tax=Cellvibrio sp. TaxID=1965322 RepID=UPI0031A2C6E9
MSRLTFLPVLMFAAISLATMAEEIRDPTMPLGRQATVLSAEEKPFVLNSVLIGSQRKIAIINGKTLREGEIVPGTNGIKVQQILAQAVVLRGGDKTWVLRISPSVVKKH